MASSVATNPSPPRVGTLATLHKVRLEMTKLYREARQGKLESSEATRLVFILQNIAKLIESSDLSTQIAELEERLDRSQGTTTQHESSNSTTAH